MVTASPGGIMARSGLEDETRLGRAPVTRGRPRRGARCRGTPCGRSSSRREFAERALEGGEHRAEVAIVGVRPAGPPRRGPRTGRAARAPGPGRAGPPPGGRRGRRAGASPPSCAARSRRRRGARRRDRGGAPRSAPRPTRARKNRSACSRERRCRWGPRRRASRRRSVSRPSQPASCAPSSHTQSAGQSISTRRLEPQHAEQMAAPLAGQARRPLRWRAERAGGAHARVTRAGPCPSARPGPRPRRRSAARARG